MAPPWWRRWQPRRRISTDRLRSPRRRLRRSVNCREMPLREESDDDLGRADSAPEPRVFATSNRVDKVRLIAHPVRRTSLGAGTRWAWLRCATACAQHRSGVFSCFASPVCRPPSYPLLAGSRGRTGLIRLSAAGNCKLCGSGANAKSNVSLRIARKSSTRSRRTRPTPPDIGCVRRQAQ